MYNINFHEQQAFSLPTYEVIGSLSVTPNRLEGDLYANEVVKSVNLNLRSIYRDTPNKQYYMIVRTTDWVQAKNEFADEEKVYLDSRSNINIPIDLLISSIGFGLKSSEIIIEFYTELSVMGGGGIGGPLIPSNPSVGISTTIRNTPIRSITVPVNLNILEDESILSSNIVISHLLGNPLPQKPLELDNTSGNITIEISDMLEIISPNIISSEHDTEERKRTYLLSSEDDIYVKLVDEVEGVYSIPIYIITDYSVDTVVCQLNIESNYGYRSSIDNIHFVSVSGVREAEPVTFTLTGVGDFDVVAPSWLNISPSSGTETTEVTVTPWYSENLGANSFTGAIDVLLGNAQALSIPVVYDVSRQALIANRSLYFTKDNLISEFYGGDQIDTEVELSVYDLSLNVKSLVKAHHQNKASFDFGYHVEDMLPVADLDSLVNSNNVVFNYKNISTLNLKIRSVNRENGISQLHRTIRDLKYIPGHTPKAIGLGNKAGVLDRKAYPQRVYRNSYVIVNFFADNIKGNIISHKTEEIQLTEIVQNITDVFGIKKQIYALPGQRVDLSLDLSQGINRKLLTKSFIVFPEPEYPINHILYQTEYDTIGCFAVAGQISMANEIEGVDIDTFIDYKRKRRRIDRTNSSIISINTGHALMSDKETVTQIMNSKQVWFDNGVQKILLVPEDYSENYTNNDSLYSAVLNFKINSDDIQDYTPAI